MRSRRCTVSAPRRVLRLPLSSEIRGPVIHQAFLRSGVGVVVRRIWADFQGVFDDVKNYDGRRRVDPQDRLKRVRSQRFMEFLNWLSTNVDGIDDLRDALYVVLGIPALVLLWWRSASANRQARAALEQAEVAQDQFRLAEQGSLTNLFQASSDMLGSEVVAVRIGVSTP